MAAKKAPKKAGKARVWTADTLMDHILDHPQCPQDSEVVAKMLVEVAANYFGIAAPDKQALVQAFTVFQLWTTEAFADAQRSGLKG